MVFDISKVSGIGEYTSVVEKDPRDDEAEKTRTVYRRGERAFLVVNAQTVEIRTDEELKRELIDKYESVMESRYFGRGGIEIVLAGKQFSDEELGDLVRLAYNLSDSD